MPWISPRPIPQAHSVAVAMYVFSPNGQFVSFTYNDHVLHERDPKLDLRNVGVAAPFGPVTRRATILMNIRAPSGACW